MAPRTRGRCHADRGQEDDPRAVLSLACFLAVSQGVRVRSELESGLLSNNADHRQKHYD